MRPGPGRCGFRNEYSGSYTVTDQNRLAGIGCGMLSLWESSRSRYACTVARREPIERAKVGHRLLPLGFCAIYLQPLGAPPPHERYAGEGSGRYCIA